MLLAQSSKVKDTQNSLIEAILNKCLGFILNTRSICKKHKDFNRICILKSNIILDIFNFESNSI